MNKFSFTYLQIDDLHKGEEADLHEQENLGKYKQRLRYENKLSKSLKLAQRVKSVCGPNALPNHSHICKSNQPDREVLKTGCNAHCNWTTSNCVPKKKNNPTIGNVVRGGDANNGEWGTNRG